MTYNGWLYHKTKPNQNKICWLVRLMSNKGKDENDSSINIIMDHGHN